MALASPPAFASPALLDALVAGLHAKKNGAGYKALCPAHEDHTPSLSIDERDGRVLVKCHAGCPQEDVIAALRQQGIWTGNGATTRNGQPSAAVSKVSNRLVATYDYRDEAGTLLYQALRYEPKGFKQRKPDGFGKWLWRLDGTPRVLYRLPELLASDPGETVYVCEGEKDVDRLRARGCVATTNVGGAGKWRDDYGDALRGRKVVILPDNDDAGRAHAAQVTRALAGVAADVRVLTLPGLPSKGDVSDWIDAGGAVSDLLRLASEAQTGDLFLSAGYRDAVPAERKILVETAREIASAAPEEPDWLVGGYLAGGAVTELTGPPKQAGKTTLAAFLFRAIVDGTPVLGQRTEKSGVLVLTEQTPTTLRESLDMAGLLDREDIAFIRWHGHRGIPFAEVMAQAAAECVRRGWRVLCVDTIGQWAGIQGDSENHSGAAMAAMEPCQDAAGLGLAVLVIRHDRKAGGAVGESGRGSNAFSGAVDIVLQLARPEGNAPPTHRVLSALSRFRDTPHRVVIDLTVDGYVCLGDVQAVVATGVRKTILDQLPAKQIEAWKFEQVLAACPPDANGRKAGRSTVQAVLDSLMASEHGPALVESANLPERGKPRVYWRLFLPEQHLYEPAERKNGQVPVAVSLSAGTTGQPAETNTGRRTGRFA